MKRKLEKNDVAYVVEDCVRTIAGRGGRLIVAMALGISKRTIDAWCSPADVLKPSADNLEKLLFMSALSKIPASYGEHNSVTVRVFDDIDNQLAEFAISKVDGDYPEDEMQAVASALYLSSVSGGVVEVAGGKIAARSCISASAFKRHNLRMMIKGNFISRKKMSEFFGVDELMLTIMISENHSYRNRCMAPSISSEKLHELIELSHVEADGELV